MDKMEKWIRVLCDYKIPIKLKRKFYNTVLLLAMLCGTECWTIKKQHIHKMNVSKMWIPRQISGNTWKDMIWNEEIHLK